MNEILKETGIWMRVLLLAITIMLASCGDDDDDSNDDNVVPLPGYGDSGAESQGSFDKDGKVSIKIFIEDGMGAVEFHRTGPLS